MIKKIYKNRSKGFFLHKNLKNKTIVIESLYRSEGIYRHHEGRPSNYFFPTLSHITRLSR